MKMNLHLILEGKINTLFLLQLSIMILLDTVYGICLHHKPKLLHKTNKKIFMFFV